MEPAPPPSSATPPERNLPGRWEELPLTDALDRPLEDLPATPDDDGPLPDLRPAWSRAFDFVRGDAYVVFMVVAFGVILLLSAVLWLLKH